MYSARCRLLAIFLALGSGCLSTRDAQEDALNQALRTSAARLSLEDFQTYFANRVEAAADDVIGMNLGPSISRRAIFWKIRVIPMSRRMLDRADDQSAYLNIRLLTEQMYDAVRDGQDKRFGAGAPIVGAAAKELVEAARRLGVGILTPEQLKRADAEFAARAKDTGMFHTEYTPEEVLTWSQTASSVLGKPVGAVRATVVDFNPAGSLNDTAAAVRRVAAVVRVLQRQADFLPRELRWSLQLLEQEVTEDPNVASVIDSFAKVSNSSLVLADTVRDMPTQMRGEVSQLLADYDQRQAGLEEMLSRVNAVVTSTDQTGQSLTKMGEVWTELIRNLTVTIEALDRPSAEPAPEPGPPFDINDYRRTADELTKTVQALSGVLTQVQQLTSPEEASSLTSVLDSAVRRILVSLGVFVLFVAVVMLGYRYVASRLA